MKLTALCGTVLIGAIAGCGGGGGGGGPVSLEALPGAYAKAVCDQNFKCSKADDIGENTKQDCLDQMTGLFSFILPEIRSSQQKNRLTYDAAKMGTCISTLATMSCADWVTGLAEPPACGEAIVPKVAVGGACQQDAECIAGVCENADTAATPPVDGACRAKVIVAHGGTCAIEDTCVDGDYCDGTCKALKAGGEPCVGSDECGYSCNDTTMKCSTYNGCNVAPVTAGGTLLSLAAMGLALAAARRKRQRA